MCPGIETVEALTDPITTLDEKRDLAETFSEEFGWRPNDLLDVPRALPTSNLVVEHGLDNAAMLSFLPYDRNLGDIEPNEWRNILELSYNSLIDWHICIDRNNIQCLYNRSDPPKTIYHDPFDQSNSSALTRTKFEQAIGIVPNPNVIALDGALLSTLSDLKSVLRIELGEVATPESISTLFNAIILARAVEDFHVRTGDRVNRPSLRINFADAEIDITEAIQRSIFESTDADASTTLFDLDLLRPFDNLSASVRKMLIERFYRHEHVPYDYDFSVMSKYALSKIYERYVSAMNHEDSVQFAMFPTGNEEAWNKVLGGVYTPQYIASFFAKYLKKNMSIEKFVDSTVIDPACGSGIFLRAVLEQKLLAKEEIGETTTNGIDMDTVLGVDIDPNAVAAARLSLALLHLAAYSELPDAVPVVTDDSLIRFAPSTDEVNGQYDAVLVNPPFVRIERQNTVWRNAVADHMNGIGKGKLDTYLAFVALSIRALRPGGFGCFVLPQNLLTSHNLKSVRNWIRDEAWIRVIADLSAIQVFKANVYVVLLIVQRKDNLQLSEPSVSLIRSQRDVGLALDDFLSDNRRSTSSYLIFDAPQSALERSTWSIAKPEALQLLVRLEAMPRLNEVAKIRQGAITGADSVFIVDSEEVPAGEEDVFRPFLQDRQMGRYVLPEESGQRMFYPYINGSPIDSERLAKEFPVTWGRINRHKDLLSSRKPIATHGLEWWRPVWLRAPDVMLSPKIVGPAVALIPRFGVDLSGKWIVKHSPFIRIDARSDGDDLLLVLAAIMNSSVAAWFIDMNASKFDRGYNRISATLLRQLPIPDFNFVANVDLREIVQLVNMVIRSDRAYDPELLDHIDDVVLRKLYFMSKEDIELLKPGLYLVR